MCPNSVLRQEVSSQLMLYRPSLSGKQSSSQPENTTPLVEVSSSAVG